MSLETVSVESIIIGVWEQMFGHNGLLQDQRRELATRSVVTFSISNYGYERDGSTHRPEWVRHFYRDLEIVVTGQHQVFIRELAMTGLPVSDWVNTSNHDSCWRTDGLQLIWETLREGWSQCWSHVPQPHQQTMREMHRSVRFNEWPGCLALLARVQTEFDPLCSSGYRRRLTQYQPVEFQITVQPQLP
jgi:hypothetical protein